VTYRLQVRSSEQEEIAVASERLSKHIPAATDTHATIEESLGDGVFCAVYAIFYVVCANSDIMQQ
jgi:hypothetical protein